MPGRKLKTWFVVADGARALILKQEGANGSLERVDYLEQEAARRRNRELVSDKPGRAFEITGPMRSDMAQMRHGMAPRTDPHRHEKQKFIKGLAAKIDEACASGVFDQLVIAAPAKALGDLRKALGQPARERIVRELSKNLTRVPEPELPAHLGLG